MTLAHFALNFDLQLRDVLPGPVPTQSNFLYFDAASFCSELLHAGCLVSLASITLWRIVAASFVIGKTLRTRERRFRKLRIVDQPADAPGLAHSLQSRNQLAVVASSLHAHIERPVRYFRSTGIVTLVVPHLHHSTGFNVSMIPMTISPHSFRSSGRMSGHAVAAREHVKCSYYRQVSFSIGMELHYMVIDIFYLWTCW